MARLRAAVGGTLVLDAEGLVKLAQGDMRAMSRAKKAVLRGADVVTAATTLTEVLRGGSKDAPVHQVLRKVRVQAIDVHEARAAGELLGLTGLPGHRCALDALVAAVALRVDRPVVLLTSDPDDMARLTEEPGRPRRERVVVVGV